MKVVLLFSAIFLCNVFTCTNLAKQFDMPCNRAETYNLERIIQQKHGNWMVKVSWSVVKHDIFLMSIYISAVFFVVVSVVNDEISRCSPTLKEFKYWLKYSVFFSAFHWRASCFAFGSPTSFQNCTSSLQACSAFQRGNMIPRSEWCQQETVCLVSFFCKLFLCLHCEMRRGGGGRGRDTGNQIAQNWLQ